MGPKGHSDMRHGIFFERQRHARLPLLRLSLAYYPFIITHNDNNNISNVLFEPVLFFGGFTKGMIRKSYISTAKTLILQHDVDIGVSTYLSSFLNKSTKSFVCIDYLLIEVRCFPYKPIVKSQHVCNTPGGKLHGKVMFTSGNIFLIS